MVQHQKEEEEKEVQIYLRREQLKSRRLNPDQCAITNDLQLRLN